MIVTLAQTNTTPGDFDGNLQGIRAGIEAARAEGADVVVFPELTIPGYLSKDRMYNPRYVAKNLETLDAVAGLTAGDSRLNVVVGYIDHSPAKAGGKPFANMAAVVRDGAVVTRYQKMLLPFYDVFDEGRYFEPGADLALLDIAGRRVGIAICEDVWNDKGQEDYRYQDNPVAACAAAGADTIIALNSSPWWHDKHLQRLDMLCQISQSHGLDVVFVNQAGGQDELVFDGNSFVVRGGKPVAVLEGQAQAGTLTVDLETAALAAAPASWQDRTEMLFQSLVVNLRDYLGKTGHTTAVAGSSGGIDSALVIAIACEALGPDNVHAVRMPSIYSSSRSSDDAAALHANLGCHDHEVAIDHMPWLEHINASLSDAAPGNRIVDGIRGRNAEGGGYAPVADENLQARMRDIILLHPTNFAPGVLALSTGNKTESACGYYTLFDMNLGFAPIMDLYKTEVFALARHVNARAGREIIPEAIITRPPTAELRPDQTDEANLLDYRVLDLIVEACIEDYVEDYDDWVAWLTSRSDRRGRYHPGGELDSDATLALLDHPRYDSREAAYRHIIRLIYLNEFKRRQSCLGTKVSRVAFGTGRRYPVVQKF